VTTLHLLPGNASALERAVSETLDYLPALGPIVATIHGFKFEDPLNASVAPWLVAEYGLGDISRFFESVESLIASGIPWQRTRGTPAAVETSLEWIGYDSAFVTDQFRHRRKWNRYQIDMGAVPPEDTEVAVLLDAEFLAGLSDAARSVFFRGFFGYDVRALEWSGSRGWSNALWGDDSGVRVAGGTVKWSHGRNHEVEIFGGRALLDGVGVILDSLSWGNFPWVAPGLTWSSVSDPVEFYGFMISRLPCYVGFFDESGEPIGWRRPIAVRRLDPLETGLTVRFQIECRTDFGDGDNREVDSVAVAFRAGNADPARPGKLWLEPAELAIEEGYSEVAVLTELGPAQFRFTHTIRENVTITMTIDISEAVPTPVEMLWDDGAQILWDSGDVIGWGFEA
jgi:hypothetical protein